MRIKQKKEFKIRQLDRENQGLVTKLTEVTTLLAILIHKSGGSVEFTKQEIENLPEVGFLMTPSEDKVEVKLDYVKDEDTEDEGTATEGN